VAKSSLLKGIDRFLIRLSRRERRILGGGATVALLLIGYVIFLGPAWERMVQLDRLIPQKEKEVGEFANLRENYTSVSSGIQKMERRLPMQNQFSPLSFLEENATKNQMRANIAYIRPLAPQVHEPYREVPVEVKVENVSLARIISFLSAIENAPHTLRIKRLSMKTRFSDPALMDITFVVSSYEKITT
jgi:type II secretory pathway component PulM